MVRGRLWFEVEAELGLAWSSGAQIEPWSSPVQWLVGCLHLSQTCSAIDIQCL